MDYLVSWGRPQRTTRTKEVGKVSNWTREWRIQAFYVVDQYWHCHGIIVFKSHLIKRRPVRRRNTPCCSYIRVLKVWLWLLWYWNNVCFCTFQFCSLWFTVHKSYRLRDCFPYTDRRPRHKKRIETKGKVGGRTC